MGAWQSGSLPNAAMTLGWFVANPLYVPLRRPEDSFGRDLS
jgi:hypothetical protein